MINKQIIAGDMSRANDIFSMLIIESGIDLNEGLDTWTKRNAKTWESGRGQIISNESCKMYSGVTSKFYLYQTYSDYDNGVNFKSYSSFKEAKRGS